MALQRQWTAKVYGQSGSTVDFIKALSTQKPLVSSLPYLKSTPTFRSRINGGYGECVLDISLPFDDFDEGGLVSFMNIVDIECIDEANPRGRRIYRGFISRYEPYFDSSANQGVRVTLLGLVSLLSTSFYKSGSSFTVEHLSQDPETIARAVLDHFNSINGGNLITYSDDSTDSVGTNVSVTFEDRKWFDAIAKAASLAGPDWWWTIDADGVFWLKPKPSEATHIFTIGRDIDSITAPKDSEGVINDIHVRGANGDTTDVSDATSQQTYGTGSPAMGKRSLIINDSELGDSAARTQRGNKELNDKKDAKLKSPFVVNTNYDIESIRVGETCRILNYDSNNTFFDDNMLIVSVAYNGDTVSIEVEDSQSFSEELRSFVQGNSSGGTGSGTGGGGGTTDEFVDRETPSGSINDSNTAFTLSATPTAGSEHIFLNGVLQDEGTDYTISGANITFLTAPETGAILRVSYRTATVTDFADRETPSGSINGSNTAFTLANTPTDGSLYVWLNGILQTETTDYSSSGTTLTMVVAPETGAILRVSYRY